MGSRSERTRRVYTRKEQETHGNFLEGQNNISNTATHRNVISEGRHQPALGHVHEQVEDSDASVTRAGPGNSQLGHI